MWSKISSSFLLFLVLGTANVCNAMDFSSLDFSSLDFSSITAAQGDIPTTTIPIDELLEFPTLTSGLVDAQVFGTAFKNILEKMAMPKDCSEVSRPSNTFECTDTSLGDILTNFFELVAFEACDVGFTGFLDAVISPLLELQANIKRCFGAETRRARELREEQEYERKLQSNINNLCVERFAEGDYDGLVERAPDLPDFEGGFNQYAWGTDFNDRLRYGVVIHSTGSGGALTGEYSLPTFTVRDVNANVVYEGVYASTLDTNGRVGPVVGLRSALVVDVQLPIVTVLASSVELTNGKFLLFEFNLDDYDGRPIFGVEPVKRFTFDAPSVRAVRLIDRDLVLYAPLFDIGGSVGFPFLRIFNWRRFRDVDTNFVLTNIDIDGGQSEASILEGFIWDFECEDEGLCFVNTISQSDPDPNVFGDEFSVPLLSYFPLEDIRRLRFDSILAPGFIPRRVLIPTQVLNTTFDLAYSAQSFEPVSKDQSLVCTLSGFLFRLGALLGNGDDSQPTVELPSFDTLEGLQEGLAFFELGEEQQCDLCLGVDKTPVPPLNIVPDGIGQCSRVQLQGQKKTTAYIWAVEECGDKLFIGTYDISAVFGDIIFQVVIGQSARTTCGTLVGLQTACAFSGQCNGDPVNDEAVCIEFTVNSINNGFPAGAKLELTADIVSEIFSDPTYTGEDFGFDLYVIEKSDLLLPNPTAVPITLNGFRQLSPGTGGNAGSDFTFDPSSQVDDAVRNMVCHKEPFSGKETLIVGSAVFEATAASNTFVIDPDCLTF